MRAGASRKEKCSGATLFTVIFESSCRCGSLRSSFEHVADCAVNLLHSVLDFTVIHHIVIRALVALAGLVLIAVALAGVLRGGGVAGRTLVV